MKIENSTIIKRNADLITADMKDNTVMMNIKTGKYHSLNSVGARIWELLESPKTVESLVQRLVAEYDISEEKCYEEVASFIKDTLKAEVLISDV